MATMEGAERNYAGGSQGKVGIPKVESLETLLALDDDDSNQAKFQVEQNGIVAQFHRVRNSNKEKYNINPVKYNSHANQHRLPEAEATEMRILESRRPIVINSNLTPNRSPYLEKGGGQGNGEEPQDQALLHVPGTGMEFNELSYTVERKQKKDGVLITRKSHLLHSITGCASKGEITALMGVSGAGRSTLLETLAGRIATANGTLGGFTMVDGRPVSPALMRQMSTYVTQGDQLFPMLTVWETLRFAAELHLHPGMSRAEKLDRVAKLIDQLGLTDVQNTYIGDKKTKGLSGGEKRLVSIGVDIIHGPALLFLDDPTSGLDSTMAYNVIDKVHDIARAGSVPVILTIHQPSSRVLQHLNRLIFLARGQLVYQGSPDYLSTHLVEFGRPVPRGESPVEYLLDLILEYDKSTYGVQPLVVFNCDGTKIDIDQDISSRSSKTPGSPPETKNDEDVSSNSLGHNAPRFSPGKAHPTRRDRSKESEMELSKSPLADRTPRRAFNAAYDHRVEAMEVADHPSQDFDEAYDHSSHYLDRPKLAAAYYKGVIDGFVDRFKFPRASPLRNVPSSPAAQKTPGRMTQPSPLGRRTPMTAPSPLPKIFQESSVVEDSPLRRLASRLYYGRSPMPTIAQRYHPHDAVISEIGPATPSTAISDRPSSTYTLNERDYRKEDLILGPKFANAWYREVLVLMFRASLNVQRSPEHFLSRQLTITFFSVLLATLFLRVRDHQSDLRGVTLTMAFFIFTVFVFFFSSMDAVQAFITERFVYIRETTQYAYRASAYVIANALVSVPLMAVQAMTYAIITWYVLDVLGVGAEPFWFFFLVLLVSLFCAWSFVLCVTALVVPNYVLAYTVVMTFSSLSLLFCGYFVHRKKIPGYWIWLHYLSTLKYPYEALVINTFGSSLLQSCYNYNYNGACSMTGKNILENLSITQLTKWESLFILLGMAVFYRFLFYCVLRFGPKNIRS